MSSVPRYLYLKALVYSNVGNMDMSRKFFAECLKRDPDMKVAQKALKNVRKAENLKKEAGEFFKQGKFEEAYAKFGSCLEFIPNNVVYNSTIYLNRALTSYKMKDLREAIVDLDSAIKLNPEYAKALVKRADIHTELEEF